jgi:tellurite resistance protein TerC
VGLRRPARALAQPRPRVRRRLADGVLALGRQPLHLHHHHGQLRRAPAVPAEGAADRHRAGAGLPRRLHRVGAAAIDRFSWVFYLFGAFLIYTAAKLAKEGGEDEDEFEENKLVAFAEKRLPATKEWNGTKVFARINGKRVITPMFLVILTLGTTDLLFALDSIPAIYGLTKEPYLVFTANIFALMGLRQLYFLIGGLLERLIYLSYGLAVLLGFIGVKLVLHALHTNELPFINGGEHVEWAPDIPIWLSLVVIIGTLAVTTVVSLAASARMSAAERDAATGPRRDWSDD